MAVATSPVTRTTAPMSDDRTGDPGEASAALEGETAADDQHRDSEGARPFHHGVRTKEPGLGPPPPRPVRGYGRQEQDHGADGGAAGDDQGHVRDPARVGLVIAQRAERLDPASQ